MGIFRKTLFFTCVVGSVVLAQTSTAQSALEDLFLDTPAIKPMSVAHVVEEGTKRTRTVRLNARLLAAVAGGLQPAGARVRLNLFADHQYTLRVLRTEVTGPGRFVTFGQLEGQADSVVIIASAAGVAVGKVTAPSLGRFSLRYAGDGWHQVSELDPQAPWRCGVGAGPTPASRQDAFSPLPRTEARLAEASAPASSAEESLARASIAAPPTMVDLMVLYTQPALDGAGGVAGVSALIDFALAEAHWCYDNSQVNVRLNLVHQGKLDYEESGAMWLDLGRLPNLSAGLRETYQADLVMLMVETESEGWAGLANGLPPPSGWRGTAFSVFRRAAIAGGQLVVHEVGHLFGCHHDRATTGGEYGTFSYSNGHRFVANDVTYITVMSYQPGIAIPYFSNPNVLFQGVPTGVPAGQPNSADNARTINEMAPIIAAYCSPANRFEFETDVFTVDDGAGAAVIRVRRAGPTNTFAAVDFQAFGGSALAGTDFVAQSGTVAFAPGETTQTLSIQILSHPGAAGDRIVSLALKSPSPGNALGLQDTAALVIRHDTPAFSFAAASYAAFERAGTVAITVRRLGNSGNAASVECATSDGTAVGGEDFASATGTFQLAAGETERTFEIKILSDDVAEPDETFAVRLRQPSASAGLVEPASALVTILDGNRAGSLDPSFDLRLGLNNHVYGLALRPDGKLLCGGAFSTANGLNLSGLAQFNPDGSLDTNFGPARVLVGKAMDSGFANGAVLPLATQPDGKILVGGIFAAINGELRNNLARLNRDGSLDSSFLPGTGPNGAVRALIAQPDGLILIGGWFSEINGALHSMVARLRADGSLDPSFVPQLGPPGFGVSALAIQSDGRIVVGGFFTSVNGWPVNNLARLTPAGGLDTTFSFSGTDGAVRQLAVLPNGQIIVAGLFGSPRPKLARLNADGTLDPTFEALPALDREVYDLAVLPDGRLLIAGAFLGARGNYLARLNRDGSLDPTFDAGLGPNDWVRALAVDPQGWLYLGGFFTAVNGQPRPHLARLRTEVIPPKFALPARRSDRQLDLGLSGLPGAAYVIETSFDLQRWAPASTNLMIGWQTRLTNAATLPREFHRARLVTPGR